MRSVLGGVESAAKQLNRVWQEPAIRPANVWTMTEAAIEPRAARRRQPRFSLLILSAGLVLTGLFVAWLLFSGDHRAAAPAATGGPALVSRAQLEQLASKVGHPVYWAGPKAGYSYEVTATGNGRLYVRYLPEGVKAGDPRASFLVVGTYTEPGAFADLKRVAKQPGSISVGTGRGGIIVYSDTRPTSVYFSHPGADYQVEVYSPSAEDARALALGGEVRPIPAP